jgi:hypothetical protein
MKGPEASAAKPDIILQFFEQQFPKLIPTPLMDTRFADSAAAQNSRLTFDFIFSTTRPGFDASVLPSRIERIS